MAEITNNNGAEEKKTPRIYGIDPGCIGAPEEVEKFTEPELYILISSLVDQIGYLTIMKMQGQDVTNDLIEIRFGLEYLINQTRKFGVELPKPEVGKHLLATPSYKKWYNFWDNHFEDFTEQQWLTFNSLLQTGKDVSEFLPNGSWQDTFNRNLGPNQGTDKGE